MFEFIFNTIQKRRLMNPREPPGKGSKRSLSMGSRHDSWQQSFNKRTLGATSSCGNCANPQCATTYWFHNTDNSCQWKYTCEGGKTYYCNGDNPII
jgi:hypothetical protein